MLAVDPHPSQPHPVSGRRWKTLATCGQIQASLAHPMSTHAEQRACPVSLAFLLPYSPCHPWGPLFSSPWSLPIIGPLTVMVSEDTHFQAGQGRDALPPRDGHALWNSQKGRAS